MCFNPMNTLRHIASLTLLVFFTIQVKGSSVVESYTIPDGHDLEVKIKMKSLDCVVTPRLNEDVKKYLDRYIFKYPQYTEKILSNAAIYFPIFDQILDEYGMPRELKALAVLESGLKQSVSSHAGAGGLWQLMPRTARMYGLTVNSVVDERSDIYRSTEAALKLLASLYDIYGDWGIALAAYNSGTVKVNKALAKVNKKNNTFWTIAPYLPAETQQFVPKFIAFNYLLEYYTDYDITPEYPDLDYQYLSRMVIYQKTAFKEIEAVTGVPVEKIRQLNPGFNKGYIPSSSKGYNLVLPEYGVAAFIAEFADATSDFNPFLAYFAKPFRQYNISPDDYVHILHQVEYDTDVFTVADRYGIEPMRIKMWNHLPGSQLSAGDFISVYLPPHRYKQYLNKTFAQVSSITRSLPDPIVSQTFVYPDLIRNTHVDSKIVHMVKPSESIMDICLLYGLDDIDSILTWNQMGNHAAIKPGMLLKIYLPAVHEDVACD